MLEALFSGLYNAFLDIIYSLSWKDIVEISALSILIYFFLKWISHDNHKKLIYYCYCYLLSMALSYWLQLPVLQHLFFLFLPIAVLIFIILHQKTLQKNFVALAALQAPQKGLQQEEWQAVIMRAALTALNKKKSCFFIIESKDSLYDFLIVPYFLQAQISKELFDLLIENSIKQENLFWISNGSIKAIDAHWNIDIQDLWSENSVQEISRTIQIALLMSQNSDCIVLYSHSASQGLNLIAQGKIINNLSATQAHNLLKQYTCAHIKEEYAHENKSFANPKH